MSEAGAGKTFECQRLQERLWNSGEPAFYLELSELAKNPMEELLSPEELERFAAWQSAQCEDAIFILDSIDELQLSQGSFRTALTKLSKALDGKLNLARIVVTSRPVAFDKEEMRKRLPVPKSDVAIHQEGWFAAVAMGEAGEVAESEAEPKHVWREVALMPLSSEHMEILAANEGVADPKKMLAEVRAQNADGYVRRPQDLIELCADWKLHGELRSHRDQVKTNIECKLQPREDRQEKVELSIEKAWEGASRLALAAVLCRKLTIRHSKDADRSLGANSTPPLEPSLILPEWGHKEITTLLQRPLFGFASYGRVRFHHRSAIEFLAADRLSRLLGMGLPTKTIKRMLFGTTSEGFEIIKPSLRPVVGWLAPENGTVFSEACIREPEALVTHGDPGSLSTADRRRVMESLVKRHGKGDWRGIQLPQIQLARLAEKKLTKDVQSHWSKGVENHEVREILLGLIEGGKLKGCADLVFDVVINRNSGYGERINALDALIGVDDPRLCDLAAAIAAEDKGWPMRLAKSALVRLFPNHMSVDQLCAALAIYSEEKDTIGDLSWSLPKLIDHEDLSSETLEGLRDGLAHLIQSTASWQKDRWPHLQSDREHLIPALVATCLKEGPKKFLSQGWLRAAVIALKIGDKDYQQREALEALSERVLSAGPDVRMRLFWEADNLLQEFKPESDPYTRFANATLREHLFLDAEDHDWVIGFLGDSGAPTDKRAVALEAAIRLPRGDVEWVEWLEGLKRHVADEVALTRNLEDRAKKRDRELERMEKRHQKHKEKAERKKKIARASWVTFWREVSINTDAVFDKNKTENTVWNLWRAMKNEKRGRPFSGWNRRLLEEAFDKDTADRARSAIMQYWRSLTPSLRSEREDGEKGTYLVKWQVGLAGIYAEAEDPFWSDRLSEKEVELALRYVSIEFNGFPSWLPDLVSAHSEIIERVLGVELLDELKERSDAGSISLQNIESAPTSLARVFFPRLMDLLEEAVKASPEADGLDHLCNRLTMLVRIVPKHGTDTEIRKLKDWAAEALASPVSMPLASILLSVMFRTDPEAAVEALEQRLKTSPEDAVPLFGGLFGDRDSAIPVGLSSGDYAPNLLLKLSKIAHEYVRRADDVKRGPGTYTPHARDHAERGRYAIVDALLSSTDTEAWPAKLALTRDPELADLKDRFFALALERAAEQADSSVASEEQVAALNSFADLAPKTWQEFYALMVDRLEDIAELLLQDDSPRGTWALIGDEMLMRREIARVLKQDSRKAYTVDQEGVTAEEKETDIRLRSTASDQEAVIELKIGEKNRTAKALAKALRTQLVEKYMAKGNCRAGCLMITVRGKRTWKHPETGQKMELDELKEFLKNEAQKIEQEMGHQLSLFIFGLDLNPRLPTEKEARS
ncbi:hypothetical protein AB1K62_14160 [Parasphingorhabdus sp. JC815]|uniref:hypothetical protein n=1 Tax=Parasphingorhabdus sp. JC815 TaxID=3232140 RepID=UPI003457623F